MLAAAVLWSCKPNAEAEDGPPNFLVLIGDDMGVESLNCYGIGASPAHTPTLDSLCNQGMRFDNFWSQPVCSPTRATILTGQYGFRNGVGTPASAETADYPIPELPASAGVEMPGGRGDGRQARNNGGGADGERRRGPREMQPNPNAQRPGYEEPANARPGLLQDAYGLPRALSADADLGYVSAAVGKWHLSDALNGGLEHPARVGFDHFAGSPNGGAVESYFAWSELVNGKITGGRTGYATSATVDDAIAWYDYAATENPWLLWVAFNAPHTPLGEPPADLLSPETAAALEDGEAHTYFVAMIEAMDTEIGRLLGAIGQQELKNTYIIFLGDNGTASNVVTLPFERGRAKGSVYQGGVNVPLMISGPGIAAGNNTAALANSVDLFSTILDLAGTGGDAALDAVALDSKSLAPVLLDHTASVREFAYADVYGPQQNQIVNKRAIRNDRYKLVLDLQNDTEELYDLSADPYEHRDLLSEDLTPEAQENYNSLIAGLENLLESDHPGDLISMESQSE
jgi:arylsulfatase A-like enzyme